MASSKKCPWNEGTCASAAAGGNLYILDWLRGHGCPWDTNTCSMAASGGHLDILKWARENGCQCDEEQCLEALRNRLFREKKN